MEDNYLGLLQKENPLYDFLAHEVLRGVLLINVSRPIFDIHALHRNLVIVRFTERHSGVQIACKFFSRKPPYDPQQPPGPDHFNRVMNQEFDNLCRMWQLGFDRPPYRVVQPLATHAATAYVLAEEYVAGPKLDAFFKGALLEGDEGQLYTRLTDLAAFLAQLHNRTGTKRLADPQVGLGYLGKILQQLLKKQVISTDQAARLERIQDQWAGAGLLDHAPEVIIHGDATPVNFVFPAPGQVVAMDLERLRPGDALADVGCVAAELRHAFFLTTGNSYAGEPFIRHFYACYAGRRCSGNQNFEAMTGRGRFWMGVTELRICRNDWLDLSYRRQLVEEAERCLRW